MKKTLPLFSANLLYAVTMLLVVFLGSTIQSRSFTWGLILTEVVLIALPALVFLRWQKIPLKSGLRLNPISPLTAVLSLVLGVSMYLFALLIEGVMAQLTGLKSVDIPANLLPKTTLDMVVFFVGLAIAAPVCEEMLFRGTVQGAYESRKSAAFAITITALMFSFYHLRLSGLPGLLPIAVVLSYVAWRTGSIYATMLVHLGNNGASAVQSLTYFTRGKGLPFVGLGSALAGLVLAIVILRIIRQLHPRPAAYPTVDPALEPAATRPWLATYWPLLLAGLVYAGVAGSQAIVALTPHAATTLDYGLPSLPSPVTTRYEIAHRGGETVGEMVCTLRPSGSEVRLDCERTIRAYEHRAGRSFFADANHHDTIEARWDAATMALRAFSLEKNYEAGPLTTSTFREGVLTSAEPNGTESVPVDPKALVEFEWAWRVALLKANSGDTFSVPFATLLTWNEKLGKSVPEVRDEVLRVGNEEDVSLSGQAVTTRKLSLGVREAWYARDDAMAGLLRPAKFDDGVLIYTMQP